MSAYVIDFSDPLKNGFSIPAGGFNGPGGSNANTTLRLYGRGALEWGEAVDEDLVRLAENFASASPPSVATAGQLWAEVTLYFHNTTAGTFAGWYFYDVNSLAVNKWTLVNGTGVVASAPSITPVIGEYYFDGTTLFRYDSLGKYEPAAYLPRSFLTGTAAPVSPTTIPRTTIRVRDAAAGTWVSPTTTTASPTASPPVNPQPGQLWYDTTTGNLLVWTGTAWQEILGPTGSSTSLATGNIDMASAYKVINMINPTAPQDAATKFYVDSAVSGVSGFLPTTGGTLSGPGNLTVSGTLTVNSLATLTAGLTVSAGNASFTTLSSSGLASLNSASTTGALSSGTTMTVGSTLTVSGAGPHPFGGQINMQTSRIINLGTPVSPADATTKAYVDAAVAGGGGPALITSFAGVPATYNAGDIAINAGKIYIANAGGTNNVVPPAGNWKQVFPAVYA